MINKELHKLAVTLNVTELSEPEPYTLTPEEEQAAIARAIEQAQKFMSWKMSRVLKTQDEIWHKISLTDWNEKIDRKKVLYQANMAKNREIWQQSQREAERQQE